MHLVSSHRRVVRSLLLPLVLVAALCIALIQPGGAAQAASLGTAGLFVPVQGRIASTATGTNTTKSPLAANTARSIQVTGVAGLPTSGMDAVLITVTVRNPTVTGSASAGPDGGTLNPVMQYADEQTNVAIKCHGTGGTWWIGKTTSNDVERAHRYFTSSSSSHQWLACGAY